MSDLDFAELEAATWDLDEQRLDMVRIRGFALAMATEVDRSKVRVDRAVAALERARKKAEDEVAAFHKTCDFAELAGRFAARAMSDDVDADTRREAAAALEELFG